MSRPIPTFGTKNDWGECLRLVEATLPLAYTLSGLFDVGEAATFIGVDQIADLGVCSKESSLLEPCYLVGDSGRDIRIRPVPQRRGGTKYAIDQRLNRHTIGLKPGGLRRDDMLIAGQLGPCTKDSASVELYNLILHGMKRRFVRIKSYWVGPQAAQLLDSGARLTVSDTSHTTFDLVR